MALNSPGITFWPSAWRKLSSPPSPLHFRGIHAPAVERDSEVPTDMKEAVTDRGSVAYRDRLVAWASQDAPDAAGEMK
eukprot:g6863.t1